MEIFNINDILACPVCRAKLSTLNNKELQQGVNYQWVQCPVCKTEYEIRNSIPVLLPPKKNSESMDYIEHYKKDAEYFDYFEERECKATEHDERRLREFIISKINPKNKIILDAGSGGSWVAKKINLKNHVLISMDISENNIQRALKEFPHERLFGIAGDGMNPPFLPNSIDCIIASEIIEHLEEPKDFVKKIIEILKPGGTLIISTPYNEKIQYYLCIHCNRMTPKNAHLHSFDEKKLISLFENESPNEVEYNSKFMEKPIKYFIFGNKALTVLRTHVILKYLPFTLWKLADRIANLILNKPAHIIIVYQKKNEI